MVTFEVILRQAEDPSSQGERTAFDLSPGEEIVFGRAPDVEITIPDPKVSGRHGKLLCDPSGELLAFDSGSLNGTFVEGEPADPKAGTPVTFGSQLCVGDYTLEIANPVEFETINKSDVAGARNALINDLEDAYGYGLDLDEPTRRSSMETAVERVITGLNRRESAVLLETILVGRAPGAADVSMAPSGLPGGPALLAQQPEIAPKTRGKVNASISPPGTYGPSTSSNPATGTPDAGSIA
ncbi:MAG: pSer/pThr/pTyr-binding forkhead associated (FHA) protein, partial [Planctomycetota bacterium]